MTGAALHPTPVTGSGVPAWGRRALGAACGAAIAGIVLLAAVGPDLLPWVPAALVATAVGLSVISRPSFALYAVLAAFVLIIDRRAGIQPREVVYGIAFFGFLGVWFAGWLAGARGALVVTTTDLAMAVFLACVATSVGLTLLFEGGIREMVGEAIPFSMLLLYFPIREAVRRSPRGLVVVLGIVTWLAVFAGARNFAAFGFYMLIITDAQQIVGARVIANEILFLFPSIGAMVFLLHETRWRGRLAAAAMFLFCFFSLVVTGSRGYWIAFAFASAVLFALLDRPRRVVLAALGGAAFVALLLVGTLVMGDLFREYAGGLVERVASIGSAATADRSLVNRFVETEAAWERVRANPVLGYGMGVPFGYLNLFSRTTLEGSFMHNGYLSLWYKFGLVGLLSALAFWALSARDGVRLYRNAAAPRLVRLVGLTAAVCLAAELPVAITSNPFAIEDAMLMFAVTGGTVAGCRLRWGGRRGAGGGAVPAFGR